MKIISEIGIQKKVRMKFVKFFLFVIAVHLAGCSPLPQKQYSAEQYKTAKIIVVSPQTTPMVQVYGAIAPIENLLIEYSIGADEIQGARQLNSAYESQRVNEVIAGGIAERLQSLDRPKPIETRVIYNKNEFVLVDELRKLQADILIVVTVSHSLLPDLSVFEVASSISLYNRSSPDPIYTIDAFSQSKVFGEPYQLGQVISRLKRTEPQRAKEIKLITKRFDKLVEEDPSQAKALRQQQAQEIKTYKATEDANIHANIKTPVSNLIVSDFALFKDILSSQVVVSGNLCRAAVEDIFGANSGDRIKKRVTRDQGRNGTSFKVDVDGYILPRYSTQDYIVFRQLLNLMNKQFNLVDSPFTGHDMIYAFPATPGEIRSRGELLVEVKNQ